jgi:hypothetical protein
MSVPVSSCKANAVEIRRDLGGIFRLLAVTNAEALS